MFSERSLAEPIGKVGREQYQMIKKNRRKGVFQLMRKSMAHILWTMVSIDEFYSRMGLGSGVS